MKTPKRMSGKFPKLLFVRRQQENDDVYYVAAVYVDDVPEDEAGATVAVYELKQERRLRVEKTLID